MDERKDVSTHFSDLEKKSQNQEKDSQSTSLPYTVSMQLVNLMQKVVEDEVSPKTVGAACQCASEIHKILKLNFEMKKYSM